MQNFSRALNERPGLLLWIPFGWFLFALIVIVLTTYPLLLQTLKFAPGSFIHWDTWDSYIVYAYNNLAGGIINYINTIIFGLWLCMTQIYGHITRTEVECETSIKKTHGILGVVFSIFGGGCAGCGVTFLINVFGGVAGTFLASLPFGGAEIGAIGTILLLISTWRVYRQIKTFIPGVCPV